MVKKTRVRHLMLPLDDNNNAGGPPIARGIEQGRRGRFAYPAETAGRCPSPPTIAFGMVIVDIFAQRSPQRALVKQNHRSLPSKKTPESYSLRAGNPFDSQNMKTALMAAPRQVHGIR